MMESLTHVKSSGGNVKKMRKRRELDALASCTGGGTACAAAASRRSRDALLSPSSDECGAADAWLKVQHRRRRRAGVGVSASLAPCGAAARACSALLVCACLIATAALMWLFVDVRTQIDELRTEMEQVTLSSQGVGDALQRCHSAARDLRNNHTELASRLERLAARQDNITQQLSLMQTGLSAVQQRLSSSSELTTAELGKSVARFGSQISDLDTRAQVLKEQTAVALAQQNDISKELQDLKSQVAKLSNMSIATDSQGKKEDLEPIINKETELAAILVDLGRNVTSINETLSTKISWATVDVSKNQKAINSLQESLQSNSASLSSLQEAWKDSNEVLAKNITNLANEQNIRFSDYYKQLTELKEIQSKINSTPSILAREEVHPIQNLSMLLSNNTDESNKGQSLKSLHERETNIPQVGGNALV